MMSRREEIAARLQELSNEREMVNMIDNSARWAAEVDRINKERMALEAELTALDAEGRS